MHLKSRQNKVELRHTGVGERLMAQVVDSSGMLCIQLGEEQRLPMLTYLAGTGSVGSVSWRIRKTINSQHKHTSSRQCESVRFLGHLSQATLLPTKVLPTSSFEEKLLKRCSSPLELGFTDPRARWAEVLAPSIHRETFPVLGLQVRLHLSHKKKKS